jgi:hypothetical protein
MRLIRQSLTDDDWEHMVNVKGILLGDCRGHRSCDRSTGWSERWRDLTAVNGSALMSTIAKHPAILSVCDQVIQRIVVGSAFEKRHHPPADGLRMSLRITSG